MSGLTDEQKKRMEENKRKALEKLQHKSSQPSTNFQPVKRPCPLVSSPSSQPATSIANRTASSFYNKSNKSIADMQREKAQVNKFKALEKLKHKTSPIKPVVEKSNNECTSSTTSSNPYPKGYHSPSKCNLTNVPKVTLTLSMKNATWFKVDNNNRQRDAVQAIAQKIGRRQYDASCGLWCFHIQDYQTAVNLFRTELNASIESVPENVVKILQRAHTDYNQKSCNGTDLADVGSELVEKLMDFQKEGIRFGIKRKGRLLIADDMGLGKTVQAIALCSYYKSEWPVLVICPSSVKMSWQQHFISWIPDVEPEDINIVNTGKDDPTLSKINIISYDLASKQVGKIYRKQFRIIVADECHFLKNHTTQRTKNIVPLLQVTKRAILLSGTPALSRPKELFTQIKALDKTLFPQYHPFSERYCAGRQTPYGWEDNGCSNDAELQAVLSSTLMVRRMKEEVLHELPEKRRQIVLLDPAMIKNTRALVSEERMFKEATSDRRSALLNYFQKTCEAKMKGVREYISEKIESGAKMIVFAHHITMLDAIEETAVLKKTDYIRMDGGTNQKLRQGMVDRFNNEPNCTLAILSLTACGTGLNITGSSNVIFAELYWNPGHLKQAEDRAYRIGQKNCVLVTYLVAKKTADDYIWPMVQNKLRVLTNLGVGTDRGFEGKTVKQDANRQKSMLDFFEQLIEEDDKDFLDQIDNMEEVKTSTSQQNESEADTEDSSKNKDDKSSIISNDATHKDLLDDSIPKDLLDDAIPKDLLDDSIPKDLLDDSIPKDLLDDSIPKDLLDDSIPDDLLNDSIPDDLLSDFSSDPLNLDDWISDDLTPDDVGEPVHKKSKIS